MAQVETYNKEAWAAYRNGRNAYMQGLRTKEGVYRYFAERGQGPGGDYHFSKGYEEAAKEAGDNADMGEALGYVEMWRVFKLDAADAAKRDGIAHDLYLARYGRRHWKDKRAES